MYPEVDQDVLLPDRLNYFFARFEYNTVPLSLPDMSKTFQRVNPRKAAGPDGIPSRVLRACADKLAGVFTDIQSILIPVCCSHMLQEGHHCSCSQES